MSGANRRRLDVIKAAKEALERKKEEQQRKKDLKNATKSNPFSTLPPLNNNNNGVTSSYSKEKEKNDMKGKEKEKVEKKKMKKMTEGDDDEDDEDGEVSEVVFDFQLVDPKEVHYHSIRQFLKDYLDGESFSSPEIADLVVGRPEVGSIIQVEGGEDPFGFISAINLKENGGKLQSVQQFKNFLLKKAKQQQHKDKLQRYFEEENTAWILNERIVNVPSEGLTPELHKTLFDEITWADEDAEAEDKPLPFNSSKFLIIVSTYTQPQKKHKGRARIVTSSSSSTQKKQQKRKREEDSSSSSEEQEEEEEVVIGGAGTLIYKNEEEEFYHKFAEFSFGYQVAKNDMAWRWTLQGNLAQTKFVCVVDKKKVPEMLRQMELQLSSTNNGGGRSETPVEDTKNLVSGKDEEEEEEEEVMTEPKQKKKQHSTK